MATPTTPASPPSPPRDKGRRRAGIAAVACILVLVLTCVAYEWAKTSERDAGRDLFRSGTLAKGTSTPQQFEANPPQEPSAADPLLDGFWRTSLWVTAFVLLLAAWVFTGRAFSDSWWGIFISRSNRASLSQLQFILWTLLFASATLALFLVRLRALTTTDAFGFDLPPEAAFLMGISAASFGGAQVIQATKRGRAPTAKDVEQAVRQTAKGDQVLAARLKKVPFGALFEDDAEDGHPVGMSLADDARGKLKASAHDVEQARDHVLSRANGVLAREKAGGARPVQLIQGDEINNRDNMDLGKTQLAFFSLVAIVAYAVLLWRLFLHGSFFGAPDLAELPPVSQGLVALLGASHVGYLGAKAAGATNQV